MEYFDSMEFDRSLNVSSRAVPNWLTCAPSILPLSFDKWLEREGQSDKTWLSEIEQCPDRLSAGPPPHCRNGLWTKAAFSPTHPNAALCMRTLTPPASRAGQQVRTCFIELNN